MPSSPDVCAHNALEADSVPDDQFADLPHTKAPPPVHHTQYYLHDEMATFLVENTLFRVHRYFLIRESEVFRWMFMCPPGKDGPEGGTDTRAIPLSEVTCKEFKSLLDFFYHGMHEDVKVNRTLSTHISLLSIASRFDMDRIRTYSIAEINKAVVDESPSPFKISPIDKLVLAQKFNIPEWLVPCYIELCMRERSLEEGEVEKIGWRTGIKLARARERVLKGLIKKDTGASAQTQTALPASTSIFNAPQSSLSPAPPPTFFWGTAALKTEGRGVPATELPAHNREKIGKIVREVFSIPPVPNASQSFAKNGSFRHKTHVV